MQRRLSDLAFLASLGLIGMGPVTPPAQRRPDWMVQRAKGKKGKPGEKARRKRGPGGQGGRKGAR